MKRILLPIGLVFLAVTLALAAGAWLPEQARPVVLGIILGVAASLPTSLVIVWRGSRRPARPAPVAPESPMVIVVPPAPPPAIATHLQRPEAGSVRAGPPVTVIGREDEV